ncbi:hypothetical protein EDD16DRAFT_1708415 [Pisolithus croceorrhizus]|nr:hypothetical protein EDD16DRAFT_1708415 [Pisolithus croceorrhizus]
MEYDDCDDKPMSYGHRSVPQASFVMDGPSDEQTNNQLRKHVCRDVDHRSPSRSLDVLATVSDYTTLELEAVAKREDEDNSPNVKALVINNMSKGRPKAANYESDVRAILETAIEIYCVILLTENPFPTSVQEVDWVKKAWSLACQHHSTKLTHDGGILKLIMARSTHICGQFKTKACPIVATTFGFEMSADKGVQAKNHLLIGELKQDSAFIFHVRGSSLDEHTGLYTNPAIQQVINEVLFKNKSDDAIKWRKYYNPFPRVAFALALTAIKCAIDEWSSSSHEMIVFKEDDYSGVFGSHLTLLNKFSQAAGDLDLVKKLLEQVYNMGW